MRAACLLFVNYLIVFTVRCLLITDECLCIKNKSSHYNHSDSFNPEPVCGSVLTTIALLSFLRYKTHELRVSVSGLKVFFVYVCCNVILLNI